MVRTNTKPDYGLITLFGVDRHFGDGTTEQHMTVVNRRDYVYCSFQFKECLYL